MRARFDVHLIALLSVAAGASVACSTLLGLGDFSVQSDAGGMDSAHDEDVDLGTANATANDSAIAIREASVTASADGDCDGDPRVRCYPCAATTQIQFLNACTSGTCVAFDDTQRLRNLLPDGALPPLPIVTANDGGAQ